ncbi:MAG: SIS domain-containing protein [Pseudomonadota bacterium]
MGLRGNYSAAFYFHYVGRIFIDNLYLLDDRLGMLIDDLGGIGPRDALLAISFEPYALEAVKATQHGAAAGAAVVAITDTAVSPIAEIAREVLLVPTGSTSFYQSLIPTISILESLLCCLAAKGGEENPRARAGRIRSAGAVWRVLAGSPR